MFSFDVETGEIFLYGVVGHEEYGCISDSMIVDALKQIGNKHVTLRINCPGGSVDVGAAMFTALKRHTAGVTTMVDSMAASMASYLMLAGKRRIIASNGMVMIHRARGGMGGTAPELRKAAEVLEKYEQRVIPEYAAASGKTDEEIMAIMEAESWYLASEAVAAGWANELEADLGIEPIVTGLLETSKNAPECLFKKRDAIRAELDSPHPFPRLAMAKQAAMALQVK